MAKRGFLILVLMGTLSGCRSDSGSPTLPEDRLSDLKQQIQDLYRQSLESGHQVPKDALEWARQDLLKIGDWEYRIVDVEGSSAKVRQDRLNELGAERWEAFWIEATPAGIPDLSETPATESAGDNSFFGPSPSLVSWRRECGIIMVGAFFGNSLQRPEGFIFAEPPPATPIRVWTRKISIIVKENLPWRNSGLEWDA